MIVTILQWNVWYQEDVRNLAALLLEFKPDIFCLQELTHDFKELVPDVPRFLADHMGYDYCDKVVPIQATDGTTVSFAIGIFSRFKLLHYKAVWTSEPQQGGGYGDEYRGYIEATLQSGKRQLTVGTTHMAYTHAFKETPTKRQETDRLVGELQCHQSGFVFTGDLNATPGSYTIAEISKHLRHVGPDFAEKTWTTKPFAYNGFEETERNWRLDYVFATPDVKVIKSEIIDTDFSDHLPILITIDV
jgi:endonuclease/exonuclease/phosphatase family metal-dependent hydrolase